MPFILQVLLAIVTQTFAFHALIRLVEKRPAGVVSALVGACLTTAVVHSRFDVPGVLTLGSLMLTAAFVHYLLRAIEMRLWPVTKVNSKA